MYFCFYFWHNTNKILKNQYKTVNKQIMGLGGAVSTNVETWRVWNGMGRPGLKLLMPSGSR